MLIFTKMFGRSWCGRKAHRHWNQVNRHDWRWYHYVNEGHVPAKRSCTWEVNTSNKIRNKRPTKIDKTQVRGQPQDQPPTKQHISSLKSTIKSLKATISAVAATEKHTSKPKPSASTSWQWKKWSDTSHATGFHALCIDTSVKLKTYHTFVHFTHMCRNASKPKTRPGVSCGSTSYSERRTISFGWIQQPRTFLHGKCDYKLTTSWSSQN